MASEMVNGTTDSHKTSHKEDGADLRELQESLLDHLQQNLRENFKTQTPDSVFLSIGSTVLGVGSGIWFSVCFLGQSKPRNCDSHNYRI